MDYYMNRTNCKASVKIQVKVFWVVIPCSVMVWHQYFRGPCYLHLQGESPWYPTTLHRVTTQKTSTRNCKAPYYVIFSILLLYQLYYVKMFSALWSVTLSTTVVTSEWETKFHIHIKQQNYIIYKYLSSCDDGSLTFSGPCSEFFWINMLEVINNKCSWVD